VFEFRELADSVPDLEWGDWERAMAEWTSYCLRHTISDREGTDEAPGDLSQLVSSADTTVRGTLEDGKPLLAKNGGPGSRVQVLLYGQIGKGRG